MAPPVLAGSKLGRFSDFSRIEPSATQRDSGLVEVRPIKTACFFRKPRPAKETDELADDAIADGADAVPTSAPVAQPDAEDIIDLASDLLRTYGEKSFAVPPYSEEDLEAFFEGWARHLILGTTAPHLLDSDSAMSPTATPESSPAEAPAQPVVPAQPEPRDLGGIRRAFRKRREREQTYVQDTLSSFREASWSFVSSMRRVLSAEQGQDRKISHRVWRLESAVQGGDAETIKLEAQEMLSHLTEFLSQRGEQHQAQISEMAARLEGLRDELDSVRAQAAIDPVTQIYNRASFDEQIEREVDLATLFGSRGCLLMADIDHFKWVNDTHGHPTGDRVLRAVADTLSRCFMRKNDFLARYGGEEFAIVLRDVDTPLAEQVAQRGLMGIRNMEVELEGTDEPLRLTVSMGLARLRPGETARSWIERADRALYEAKNAGRDRIVPDLIDMETDAAPS